MATSAQQSSGSDPERLVASPEKDSPVESRKGLLAELLQEEKKDRREALSKEVVAEVKDEDKSEKERLELLCAVLDQQSAEEIDLHLAALKDKPEEASEAKAEALLFFRDTFPYFFAVLALKHKLAPNVEAKAFLQIADKVTDPQEKALLRALDFLENNPNLESSVVYKEKLSSDVQKDATVLYDAAKEVLDEEKGAGTWMKEKMAAHPVATAALLGLGAVGVYKFGKWLYKKARGETDEKPETAKKPGLLSEVFSGWSFVKKAAVSTALFAGGLLVAGRVMGMDGFEAWAKKNHMGGLYKLRFFAAVSHFSYGRIEEGLATWNYGARSDEERERHSVYSEFFGTTDYGMWMIAGLKVKDLLEADSAREYPLAAGIFGSIPWIKEYFKMPEQIKMEELVKAKLAGKMETLRESIPGADDMNVDELLKKAFELRLFETKESAGWEGYGEGMQGLIEDQEKSSDDYAEKVDGAVKGKDVLEDEDLSVLRDSQVEVTAKLDELRMARPTYWSDMQGLVEKTIPWFTFEDDELQNQDYIKARASYKAFFEKAQKDDLDAIGADMQELEKIGVFLNGLKPGEPLTAADKTLLEKHSNSMKEIHKRVTESLVRAKITRDKAIKEDKGEHWYDVELDDAKEVGQLYLHAYKGVWYGLEWSVNEIVDENTGFKGKVLGFAGVVVSGAAAGSVAFDVAQGAMAINNGKVVSGFLRTVLMPGHSLPLFGYRHMRANPMNLLEKVIKGGMHPDTARRYCEGALKESDVFWKNWYHVGDVLWAKRVKDLEMLKTIFESTSHQQWLDDLVNGVPNVTCDVTTDWQAAFKDMVRRRFKMELPEFLAKMKLERGDKRVLIDALEKIPLKERLIQFFEKMGQKLGRRAIPRHLLEKWFERGGAGLQYLKYFASKGTPLGVAYLSTYWVCSETYEAKDKGERVLTAATGLLVAEATWRGFQAMKLAPKHPFIMGCVALGATLGLTITAENLVAPHLKSRTFVPTALRGAAAPVLYTAGAGQLFDTIGHYYNTASSAEKDYFTRTTYLPLIGERKMAFHDGAFLAGGEYFEERSPEEAVAVWNSQVQSAIGDLKAEEAASKDSEKPVDNSAKIEELEAKIIDRDWNHRQIQRITSLKAEIRVRGGELFDAIVAQYNSSLTTEERVLMESLLIKDAPESWMDESMMDINKEERYATVMRFAKELGQEDELLTFLEKKRLIYSDIQFYQSIGRSKEIMQPSRKEELIAMLGIDPTLADNADQTYEDLVSTLGLDDLSELDELTEAETAAGDEAAKAA